MERAFPHDQDAEENNGGNCTSVFAAAAKSFYIKEGSEPPGPDTRRRRKI